MRARNGEEHVVEHRHVTVDKDRALGSPCLLGHNRMRISLD